jgi:hypothetical protein
MRSPKPGRRVWVSAWPHTWVPVMIREMPRLAGYFEYHIECPNLPTSGAPCESWLAAFEKAMDVYERHGDGLPWRLTKWDDNGWPMSDLDLPTLATATTQELLDELREREAVRPVTLEMKSRRGELMPPILNRNPRMIEAPPRGGGTLSVGGTVAIEWYDAFVMHSAGVAPLWKGDIFAVVDD